MIGLVVTLPKFGDDIASQKIWSNIQASLTELEGICYYMHPYLKTHSGIVPELTILTKTHQPIIIRCLSYQINEINNINDTFWTINDNNEIDSPLQETEDFVFLLSSKLGNDRELRKKIKPICLLALPLITQHDFENKFSSFESQNKVIWKDSEIYSFVEKINPHLTENEWRLTRSIVQGVNPLTKGGGKKPIEINTLGDAIRSIDRNIALLDDEQEKAALQIAPGPQRIRGMAGTGKTVLLAMKAAHIHQRYPDKRILFTFYTQSLYNQIHTLITKFYRFHSDSDPDWEYLHIRHAWGGYRKPGVYFDTCMNLGIQPMTYQFAKKSNWNSPLVECCKHVLLREIEPIYDYIMIDEAQDLPTEFFQLLFRLSMPPNHNVYWVYDELQSLFGEEIPSPEKLFGLDENGIPNVTLEGEAYPGGIEKDFILHKSYRCTQRVLMLAHAIGLGLYGPEIIQMLSKKESWEAFGYIIEEGELQEGNAVIIYRPPKNSPNQINEIYNGIQEVIISKVFETREEEYDWIANSIYDDVKKEKVLPEHIIVICLDAVNMKKHLPPIQMRLLNLGLQSAIPGLIDDSSSFAEDGRITLATVLRAKGNESYIVYVFCFDSLYNYVEGVQNRNRAFTAITRSKAWVRITGIGKGMKYAKEEIDRILNDQPRFKFIFPDMEKIRDLDAEIARRRRDLQKVKINLEDLAGIDPNAIGALAEQNPNLFNKVKKIFEEAGKKIEP